MQDISIQSNLKMRKILLALLLTVVFAQNIGTQKQEYHIPFPYSECTGSGCTTKSGGITLDENWRWVHNNEGYTNCFTGTEWDRTLCPDPQTCTRNCAIDGVPSGDWINPYGVNQIQNGISMKLVTHGQYGDNIGSRVYLLENDDTYKIFKLKNREFSFDVDSSQLDCGINGALYFVEMEADGGKKKYPGNKAGAKYGTGYCDAQCPHDIKFVWGEANSRDWVNDQGHYGSCCAEFDVWEANKLANAFTAHPCKTPGYYRCENTECGDKSERYKGVCDKDGCDINPFRNGNKNFFGPGSQYKLDTTKPFKVVTQFATVDNTDKGDLSQIKRFFVQDGKKIENPATNISGLGQYSTITNQNCGNQKRVFGEADSFQSNGGLKAMGQAFDRGMVLVLSLWDDGDAHMLWLDGEYPLDKDPNAAGVKRGPCSRDSGNPSDVRRQHPDATVKYSNVKFGNIGSTVQFATDGVTVVEESNLSSE